MDEQHEYRLRRKAIRLLVKGIEPRVIFKRVGRGRTWLAKWYTRFEQQGPPGLKSQSRRPHQTPTACRS